MEAYQYHFRTLQRYFDPQQELGMFHEGHFRDYQKWRLAAGAGASLINHELGALAQLLELAGLWHPISKYYEHLPERNWSPPKVMTPEEEDRFLRFAKRKPEWKTALNSALLTSNTTIAGDCLRTLKLESIRLEQDPPVILVPATAKNRNRVRGVPLNRVAYAAVRELFVQAKERGSSEPQHQSQLFGTVLSNVDLAQGSRRFLQKSASVGAVFLSRIPTSPLANDVRCAASI